MRLTRNWVTTFLVAQIGDYINDSCQNLEPAVCVIFQKGPIVMNLAVTALFTQQTSVFGFVCSTKQKGLALNLGTLSA